MIMKRLLPYAAIFASLQLLTRLSLMARALGDVELSLGETAGLLLRGVWFDTVTFAFFALPLMLYLLALPAGRHAGALDRRADRVCRFVFSFILLFDAVAEHLFWSEFATRFNFIAVDYLIYTQEVVGNIKESYPLHLVIPAIALGAAAISRASLRLMPFAPAAQPSFRRRLRALGATAAACGCLYAASATRQAEIPGNAEATELASNGIYNLFSAFWNNEISYTRFYINRPEGDVEKTAHRLLDEPNAEFLHKDGKDLTRIIRAHGSEKHKNVMLVVMESMSADYMGAFGNTGNLTPNLDRFAREGLSFNNLFATGTRTVRGLEAVTLSIPPTPGQSIIRRPGNDNLFSLGFIFKDRGYDTRFIYGGYGYFDNMNAFFSGNGFDIIDRTAMRSEEVHFANVWGICDEDMFTRAIREADESHRSGKPFMHLIMTTSNHRPFTYPEGRVDIASHSGRPGGVKYADYSIGKLIADAKDKPWFRDTLFVFVADHTAGAGGKAELDPHKYHIPLVFYAPGFIKPAHYDKIASQIDTAPILLGLLDFTYYTKFFGEDLLHDPDEAPHAFISNYQKVALAKDNGLTILAPGQAAQHFTWPDIAADNARDPNLEDAIAYFQSASWWREAYKRIPTVVQARKH